MEHGLDVAAGGEAAAGEALLDVAKVVDLAVTDDDARTVLAVNGLLAAVEIDDGEPPHAQRHGALDMMPGVVGTAVREHVGHGAQNGRIGASAVSVVEDAADTAHEGSVPFGVATFAAHGGHLVREQAEEEDNHGRYQKEERCGR